MVALYCRVSTEEQAKFGFSIDAQKNALIKYCEENKLNYELFVDEGISASSMKRPSLQRFLARVNEFDTLLFTKLDRLSRNVLDANTINSTLMKSGVTMKAIDEDDIDTTTADGMFMFNLKVSLAQREIGKTSERINFVFADKRSKGEVTSGKKKIGYDIVNKKYVINEEEAKKVIDLYNYFLSVNGKMNLTYLYYKKQFPMSSSYSTMKRMLMNKSYIGIHKLRYQDVELENYVPRIMDDELFYRVQSLMKRKEKRDPIEKRTYIFSGILYCGVCGHRLPGRNQKTRPNLKNYYMCKKAYGVENEGICNNRNYIREAVIEDYLLEHLEEDFNKFKVEFKEKEPKRDVNAAAKIKTKIEKIKDLYMEDLIDKETYKKDYEKLQAELKAVENAPKEDRDFSQIEGLLNKNWKEIYLELTPENRRTFWLAIIDKIIIEDGEIKRVLFY